MPKIKDRGREWIESGGGKEKGKKGKRKETSDLFVPTQADLFRSIGEKLSMAQGRGREEKGGRERKRERKETNERRQCSESGGTKEIRNERSPTERPPPPSLPCPLILPLFRQEPS